MMAFMSASSALAAGSERAVESRRVSFCSFRAVKSSSSESVLDTTPQHAGVTLFEVVHGVEDAEHKSEPAHSVADFRIGEKVAMVATPTAPAARTP